MPRDSWLDSGVRERARLTKAAAQVKGQFDPASDHTYRMITAPGLVKITHWGGRSDPSGRVVLLQKSAPEQPASRQLKDPFTTFYVQGIALEPPLPPDRMLNLTEENTLHSACLMAKATDACGRGWEFAPREGKEGDKSLLESELPERLKAAVKSLTPELTFSELLYQAAWEMDSIGWGVWEVVRQFKKGVTPGQYAPVGAIYPIPAHTIRATLDPRKWVQIRAGRVRYFKKFGAKCEINNETGTVHEWDRPTDRREIAKMDPDYVASEFIIFKTYTPRSLWYGLPRWVSAIATVAEMTAIREFNVSWFASGGQTDYHIHFSAESLDTAKSMVEQVQQQMLENQGRGHTLLLTAGTADTQAAVSKLGELLREGHFRFRRQDLAKEVLIAHSVPPYRIGWAETGSLGGNAAKEMLDAYNFGGIKPIQVIIEERLHQTLFNADAGVKTDDFRFKLRDFALEGPDDLLNLATRTVQYGILTPNEGREKLDMEQSDDPEADKLHFQGQPLGGDEDEGGGGGFDWGGVGEDTGEDGYDPEAADAALEEAHERKRGKGKKGRRKMYKDVVALIAGFEQTLKDALANEVLPTDTKPRKRPRGTPETVSPAGPARADKPNIV